MKPINLKFSYSKFFSILLAVAFIVSCQQEDDPGVISPIAKGNDKGKYEFSKSFSGALANEPSIRSFIKAEALEMMDGDYDVLYALVKHKKLSNGKTFEETLSVHFGGIEKLRAIEHESPLLTIFVPSLPENSFSAEKWSSENEIPYVAVRLSDSNDVPIISPNGEEYLLDAELIPSYPVVVIKDNERMVYEGQSGFKESRSKRILKSINGISYKFIDDVFDNELEIQKEASAGSNRIVQSYEIDPKLVQAQETYFFNDGWERDFIYYNISPSSQSGQFTYDFLETIRYFKLVGDAWTAYTKIADQTGDPMIKSGKNSSGWTDGYFEIRANVLIQAKNGIGPFVSNYFLINGAGLFNVTYTVERRGVWPFRYDYYIINKSTMTTNALTNISIPIVNWDLNSYAATFRIDMEESDNTTIVNESTTDFTKFATNFGIEANVLKKIGLKFGASLELSVTNTVTKSYTLNSDPLGTVIVNFADEIITSNCYPASACNYQYNIREYSAGIFAITVEPKRVQ